MHILLYRRCESHDSIHCCVSNVLLTGYEGTDEDSLLLNQKSSKSGSSGTPNLISGSTAGTCTHAYILWLYNIQLYAGIEHCSNRAFRDVHYTLGPYS